MKIARLSKRLEALKMAATYAKEKSEKWGEVIENYEELETLLESPEDLTEARIDFLTEWFNS